MASPSEVKQARSQKGVSHSLSETNRSPQENSNSRRGSGNRDGKIDQPKTPLQRLKLEAEALGKRSRRAASHRSQTIPMSLRAVQ